MDAIGPEAALELFLRFGGAELYYASRPTRRSELVRRMGSDVARKLSVAHAEVGLLRRIPIGNRRIAATLRARGKTVSEIARTVRASDTTVRRWLKEAEQCESEGKPV